MVDWRLSKMSIHQAIIRSDDKQSIIARNTPQFGKIDCENKLCVESQCQVLAMLGTKKMYSPNDTVF